MASYGKSTTLIIHSLKVILMSTGVLFIAILLVSNLSLPRVLGTSSLPVSELIPNLWSSFSLRGWLRPPYLYFIINAIILTIAASSRLHHQNHHATSQHHHPKVAHHQHHQNDVISVVQYDAVSIMDVVNSATGSYHYDAVPVKGNDDGDHVKVVPGEDIVEKKVMVEEVIVNDVINKTIISDHDEVAKVVNPKVDLDEMSTRRTQIPPPRPLTRQEPVAEFLSSERPPTSSRFGHHRRPAKGASPVEGGKALRVSRPKKHDTLESTWKAITEGRHIPLTRHLKKSDTWENQGRQINLLDDDPPAPVKKSETFKDRTNYSPPPVPTLSKLKKDPSLSQDELNRRVEAFIHKFNEDMRLQRQQSIQQFMEKINRAAY